MLIQNSCNYEATNIAKVIFQYVPGCGDGGGEVWWLWEGGGDGGEVWCNLVLAKVCLLVKILQLEVLLVRTVQPKAVVVQGDTVKKVV